MKLAAYLYILGGLALGASFADFQKKRCDYKFSDTLALAITWPIMIPVAMVAVSLGAEGKERNKCEAAR